MDVPFSADDIKTLAPKLTKNASDDTINALAQSAWLNAIADGFPVTIVNRDGETVAIRELAAKYLTCHFLSMDTAAGQGITSEQVDVIHRTWESKIGKDWLHSSVWGLYYYRLWKEYGGDSQRYVVVQH